jgi:hypothetical protein
MYSNLGGPEWFLLLGDTLNVRGWPRREAARACCVDYADAPAVAPVFGGKTGACPWGRTSTPGNGGIFPGVESTIHSEPDRSDGSGLFRRLMA